MGIELYNKNMNKTKELSKQEIQNIRLRAKKLVWAIKDEVDIPFNYIVEGSLSKGRKVSVDENGKYDIDIAITFKGKDKNAQQVYQTFKQAFSKHMRIKESFIKKTRVIRVTKETDFYLDIALVDYYSSQKRIVTKNKKGQYEWAIK